MKTINDVVFSKFNGVLVNKVVESSTVLSMNELVTIFKKMSIYNYVPSKELLAVFLANNREDSIHLVKTIMETLDKALGDKGYKPMYKGFPQEVMTKSEDELFFDQIVHYVTKFVPDSGEDLLKEEVAPSAIRDLIPLKVVTMKDVVKLTEDLLASNVVLSKGDVENLEVCLNYLPKGKIEELLEDVTIVVKETLVKIAMMLNKKGILMPNFKTATDVLRLMVELTNEAFIAKDPYYAKQEVNKKHITFKKFSNAEIRFIYRLLENMGNIVDDQNTYKRPWKTFYAYTNDRVNWKKFPKVKFAKDVLYGKETYETTLYKLQQKYMEYKTTQEMAMSDSDIMYYLTNLLEQYKKRPGHFARNIVAILSVDNDLNASKFIINSFMSVIEGVNSRVIYQLLDRLNNMGSVARVVSVGSHATILEETRCLDDDVKNYFMEYLVQELRIRASRKEPMGLTYISEEFANIALTTSERGSNEALHPMTRGSRIYFNKDAEVLRFFTGWKNMENSSEENYWDDGRIDIDLSVTAFNENFEESAEVSYYCSGDREEFTFSGDLTDAPDGAVEYIDVNNIDRALAKGYKYLLMNIYSYSNVTFDKLNSVYAGVMELTTREATSGKNFYSSAVSQGFSITSPETNVSTILVNLEDGYYIWLDASTKAVNGVNNSVTNTTKNAYVEYIMNKKYIPMYSILQLNVEARGVEVASPEDAVNGTVLELNQENPLPLADILANYL